MTKHPAAFLLLTPPRKASKKTESIGAVLGLHGLTASLVPEPKTGLYAPSLVLTLHFLSQQKPSQPPALQTPNSLTPPPLDIADLHLESATS